MEKIETKLKVQSKATSINGREVYSEENGFTVNTDYCKEIFDGTKYTYTFPVFREVDNGLLENLLLVEDTDGSYMAYLIQYELTDDEKTAINFLQPVDMERKVTFIEINDDGLTDDIFGKYYYNGSCYEDNYVYQEATNCLGSEQHPYSVGSACPLWGTINTATSGGYVNIPTLVSCDGGGGYPSNGGNAPDYNPTNPNSNPNHGGSSGSSTTTITCKTNCFVPNPIHIIEIQLNDILDEGDSYVIDSTLDLNNTLSFNSVNDFQLFLDDQTLELGQNTTVQNGNIKTEFTINYAGTLAKLEINVISKLENPTNNQAYELLEVNSETIGFWPLTSWNQSDDEMAHSIDNVNNVVTIYFEGTMTYGIDIDGIPVSWSESFNYTLVINILNGQPISITKTN